MRRAARMICARLRSRTVSIASGLRKLRILRRRVPTALLAQRLRPRGEIVGGIDLDLRSARLEEVTRPASEDVFRGGETGNVRAHDAVAQRACAAETQVLDLGANRVTERPDL